MKKVKNSINNAFNFMEDAFGSERAAKKLAVGSFLGGFVGTGIAMGSCISDERKRRRNR